MLHPSTPQLGSGMSSTLVFIHLNDGPQRRQQQYLEQGFWSVTIFLAKCLPGTNQSPPLSPSPALPNFNPTLPSTSITSCPSVSAYSEEIKSVISMAAVCTVSSPRADSYRIYSHSARSAHPLLHRNGRIKPAVTNMRQHTIPHVDRQRQLVSTTQDLGDTIQV